MKPSITPEQLAKYANYEAGWIGYMKERVAALSSQRSIEQVEVALEYNRAGSGLRLAEGLITRKQHPSDNAQLPFAYRSDYIEIDCGWSTIDRMYVLLHELTHAVRIYDPGNTHDVPFWANVITLGQQLRFPSWYTVCRIAIEAPYMVPMLMQIDALDPRLRVRLTGALLRPAEFGFRYLEYRMHEYDLMPIAEYPWQLWLKYDEPAGEL